MSWFRNHTNIKKSAFWLSNFLIHCIHLLIFIFYITPIFHLPSRHNIRVYLSWNFLVNVFWQSSEVFTHSKFRIIIETLINIIPVTQCIFSLHFKFSAAKFSLGKFLLFFNALASLFWKPKRFVNYNNFPSHLHIYSSM